MLPRTTHRSLLTVYVLILLLSTVGQEALGDERGGLPAAQEQDLLTPERVRVLINEGEQIRLQVSYAQALDIFRRAQNVAERIGDRAGLADALDSIGRVLRLQGKYDQALEFHEKSLAISEQMGDKKRSAAALTNIGIVRYWQNRYDQAMDLYRRGLALREASEDKAGVAQTLYYIGQAERMRSDLPQALETFQKSLALSEASGDREGAALALYGLGGIYNGQGKYAQAFESFQKSLALRELLGDRAGVAHTLGQIGIYHRLQSNYDQALESLQKSLASFEALGDAAGTAFASLNIGIVYRLQGNYARALKYYQKSLPLYESLGEKAGLGSALISTGNAHRFLGDNAQALGHYRRALALFEASGSKPGMIVALANIGIVHRLEGNYAQSLEYLGRTLALEKELGIESGVAETLGGIGKVYRLQRDYAQALAYYQKSLALSESLGEKAGIASALSDIADVRYLQGDATGAAEFAERAASISRQIGSRETLWEALTTAGKAYRSLNQTASARRALEEAIETVESLRANVTGQETRAAYFAMVREPLELYIGLLMQQHRQHPSEGHDANAWQVSERARARSLLEALGEARADIRQGVSPSLLQRERTLQHQLNAKAERQTRLLSGEHTAEQAAAIKKEIDALAAAYREVQAQIRHSSPRYAALTQPVPLTLREVQQRVLDRETVLLQYALGEEKSYLWAVTPDSLTSFELPERALIEQEARRVRDLLADGNRWATSATIDAEYERAAGALSRMLLPAPLITRLGTKRLIVVADGVLQYLPFGALPVPSAEDGEKDHRTSNDKPQSPSSGPRPLILEHEIVSLPSASTIDVLRREASGRTPATKSIAVLADPVFDAEDERVATTARGRGGEQSGGRLAAGGTQRRASMPPRPQLSAELTRAAGAVGVLRDGQQSITRLPFSRREAEVILASSPGGQGRKALDFEANRATATSTELANYRFVHFATHGLLNSEHPELSGIVLSLVDEKGQPIDGFLRLNEIYNLHLPAEMVVLSACQTGLGREIRGEGLVGLVRGFMYAGSPRVVASLWKVDDRATAELMKRFYEGVLRQGLRPAAALRQAKIEMWKQQQWRGPFFWAAFELQGEWR